VCRLGWRSVQNVAACLRGCTRLERVLRAARLTLQMSENPVDHSRISDERDDLHLSPTGAEEWVHFENLLNQASPRCPASLNELRGRLDRCARVGRRRGLLLTDFRRLCAVGNRPIVPHAMAAAIRDVGGDGVDPVEGIEETKGRAGAGIGRCGDLEHSVVSSADTIGVKRGAGYVAGEPVELLGILRRERFSGEHGKSGMHPGEKILHKALRKTFLFMEAAQEKTAKQFADSGRIERGKFEKFPFIRPNPIGNNRVAMGVEVSPIGTERLNRDDAAGANIFAVKQRLEGPADGLVSGAGKEAQEAAFSLEQAPDGFGDREGPMAVRSRREDLGSEFLGKQGGALGLTTAAEISCAA
jgi:hypothetical protein